MKDESRAQALAELLDQHNQDRKEEELRIVEAATKEVENSSEHKDALVLVVYHESWHPGVVGIVASRLAERFGKPAVVIGSDGKGSGRSIPAFHLHEAVSSASTLLKGFGGHAHAIGLHIDPRQISLFRDNLNSYAKYVLNADDFVQKIIHDGECEIERLSEDFVNELDRASPFGRGNPEPVFLFRQVRFLHVKELRGGHLRGTIAKRKEIPFVSFGKRDAVLYNNVVGDVLATLEINEWNQNSSLQLRVKDIRIA